MYHLTQKQRPRRLESEPQQRQEEPKSRYNSGDASTLLLRVFSLPFPSLRQTLTVNALLI
jgi:hypothetical protein